MIGRRGTGADIEVDDPRVRSDHARIQVDRDGRWCVRAATGRVYLNGVRRAVSVLDEGHAFVLGQTSITVSPALLGRRPTEAVQTSSGRGLPVVLRDVCVFRDGLTLLDHASISIEPGEIVAIVGPSGAGKSTLIKVLLGEFRPDLGTVMIGGSGVGEHQDGRMMRDQVRYVPQSDDLYHSLTVRETLGFAARFRASPDTAAIESRQRVESVLAWLGLQPRRNALIRDLSGGQRRRVSIGLELVGRPQLLLLDEPTSGLDLGKDRELMHRLRQVAREYRCTVIVVTHSVSHLAEVDQLVVLARGGRIRHAGPPGSALASSGHRDWADWLLTLDAEEASPAERRAPSGPAPSTVAPLGPALGGFRNALPRQLTLIRRRGWRSITALLAMPLIGTGIAALASPTGLRGPQATQVLAILATVAGLTGAALSYQDLVNERAVLKRDWRVGVSAATLLWSKAAVYAAGCGVLAAMMTALYSVARSLPDPRFGLAPGAAIFLVLFGIMLSSMGLGLFISAVSGSAERAVTWNTLLAVVQVALNGALFKLPVALHLLSPAIPARLGLGALASYAGINDGRSAAGLYTDPLWRPTGVYFWLLLLTTGLLFVCSTFIAIWTAERTWRRGDHHSRVTGP